MPNFGIDTRDINALGWTHPAERKLGTKEREDANRAAGRRYRRQGSSILVGVFLGALACAVLAEGQVFHSVNAEIFAALGMFALIAIGSVVLAAGVNERREQPLRAMTRLSITKGNENAERLELCLKILEANNARLKAVEEVIDKVPAFGEGVVLGVELRNSTLGTDD